jgi:hypothetical protein
MDLPASTITQAYLEHLTERDHALLVAADPQLEPRRPGRNDGGLPLSVAPGRLERLLASPEVFDRVFGPASAEEPLLAASPFLVFAVAVHHAAAYLESATYVAEWLGPGRRAPVFDVAPLRDFLSGAGRRLFLAELLASYTHVTSGSVMVPTRRGRRRQRFSELDPVRLAGLLEVVADSERPGILRRLGDLALFLTGVFPDHVARRGFGSVEEGRLRRAGGIGGRREQIAPGDPGWVGFGDPGAVGLLEQLGRTWYRAAFELLAPPVPVTMAAVGELPERFGQARRILNLVTDRFLFAHRDRWFGFGQAS